MKNKNKNNESLVITLEEANRASYDLVMQSTKEIGPFVMASIPVSIIEADERFQRTDCSSRSKIESLARRWDYNKMDPLKVSPHPETGTFSVIDGYHRLQSLKIKGIKYAICIILQNLGEDPEERLIQEATLFATQRDETERLDKVQLHKANLIRKIPENIILQKIVDKYGIKIAKVLGTKKKAENILCAINTALRIAREGEWWLDKTLKILVDSRWSMMDFGLSEYAIDTVYHVLRLHEDHLKEIEDAMIQYMRSNSPRSFKSESEVKYSKQGAKARMILLMEDYVCDTFNMEKIFMKDAGIVRINFKNVG